MYINIFDSFEHIYLKLTLLHSESNGVKKSYEYCRALIPLFWNGAGAFRIGKTSVILTKIGKNQNVLCMKLLMSN